jgi:hypothetical protein
VKIAVFRQKNGQKTAKNSEIQGDIRAIFTRIGRKTSFGARKMAENDRKWRKRIKDSSEKSRKMGRNGGKNRKNKGERRNKTKQKKNSIFKISQKKTNKNKKSLLKNPLFNIKPVQYS